MNKRLILIGWLSCCCYLLYPQSDTVLRFKARMDKSQANEQEITELKEWLKQATVSPADRLALQTALVKEYQELNQWDACLNYCQEQVAEARRTGNLLAEATFLKHIGNTYYHIPDKKKAIPFWEKCIAISASNGFYLLHQQCLNNLGGYYIDINANLPQAEQYLSEAIRIGTQHPDPDQTQLNQNYRLLATLYDRTNQFKKAEKLFLEVIEKSRSIHDKEGETEAMMFYSGVLARMKNYDKAKQISAEAVVLSEQLNRLDLLHTALALQAENLYLAGDYKQAYEVKNRLEVAIRERFDGDLNTKISEAEARLKTAEGEHEKQLALLKAKKEKQLLVFGLIGFFIILFLLLYTYYQRRHTRQKLQLQVQIQEEKGRLSRDLHDNLGSQLTLLSNNIETLDIRQKKQQDISDQLEKVKGSSKQLLQTLRETIWILNREQVPAQEFFDKLVDYTHRFLHTAGGMQLRVEEDFAGQRILQSNEALQLFRICQEAINNACKYSGAAELYLSGKAVDGKFYIRIEDKGNGFAPDQLEEQERYGLKNMRERASGIGAVLQIHAAINQGTTIFISL
jgi:signal transduction histidine kinase